MRDAEGVLRHAGRRGIAALLMMGALLCGHAEGHAAPGARAEAEKLFREGKKLYDAGKYKEACEALAASDTLDPAIGTLGLLAACHEKQGRLLDAWKEYLGTKERAEAKRDERAAYAAERAQAVKARLSKITIESRDDATKLEITRDGEGIPPSLIGVAVPVDPGEHVVLARNAKQKEWKTVVNLKEGEANTVVIPSFETMNTASGPPRWLSYAAFGVGLAGVAAGAAAGGIALAKNADSNDPAVCAKAAPSCAPRDTARTAATVSTISFAAGGGFVGLGLVLFLLSKPAPPPEEGENAQSSRIRVYPSVSPSGFFLGASGSF